MAFIFKYPLLLGIEGTGRLQARKPYERVQLPANFPVKQPNYNRARIQGAVFGGSLWVIGNIAKHDRAWKGMFMCSLYAGFFSWVMVKWEMVEYYKKQSYYWHLKDYKNIISMATTRNTDAPGWLPDSPPYRHLRQKGEFALEDEWVAKNDPMPILRTRRVYGGIVVNQ